MRSPAIKDAERYAFSVHVTKAFALFGVVVSTIDYLDHRYITFAGDAFISIAGFLVLYLSRSPHYAALPLKFSRWLLIGMYVGGAFTVMPYSLENAIWAIIFPFAFFYLTGLRTGTRISVLCILSLPLSYVIFPFFSDTPRISLYGLLQLIGASSMGALLAYRYEQVREKQAEELKKLAEQAQAGSRAKSEFLSNMSHEIRTPMNSVLGMSYLALKAEHDPRQRDYLEKIRLSGEHMLGIINDILDFSKIEAGKMLIDHACFDLDGLLKKLDNLLAWRAAAKGLCLRFDIDPAIPRKLCGDPLRLNQVLLNYVNNAIKFTEQGEVTVRARLLEQAGGNCRVRFEVQDTGIGIGEEQQAELFQPFHQADNTSTRQFGGTGLGLAISKRLAELMGGEVGVASRPGQGSTFWFAVSLSEGDGTIAPLADDASGQAAMPGRRLLWGARILVVENNEFNQQVAREFLESVGARVRMAGNGREALDRLAGESFDCILMDVQMPVLDGMETTRLIRADPRTAGVRVIAMTANASNEDREKCLAAGMDGFISKPIHPEALYAMLAQYLAGRMAEAGAAAPPGDDGIIDWTRMIEMFGGEKEKAMNFFRRFLASTRASMRETDAALQRGDMHALAALMHDMKSISSLMGARSFSELCAGLERAVMQPVSTEGIQETIRELHALLERMERQAVAQCGCN